MKVNGMSGGVNVQAAHTGPQQEDDLISKNLKRQIEDLQKQLQELSSDTQMSGEQKMKKRQEFQKQISDLNMQLRQHQIELRRQKQQEKEESDNIFESGAIKNTPNQGNNTTGLSQGSMEAMISADASMKQASKQGSVASKMEGRAGVLEVEIKLDSARNGDTSAKQAELAKVEQKAANATASQISTLNKANKEVEEAAKSEQGTKKSDASKNGAKDTKDIENKENPENVGKDESKKDTDALNTSENASNKNDMEYGVYNTSVDVRI